MARSLKPQFGSRHRRAAHKKALGEPQATRRRFDWQLVSLVTIVFVASFVCLFPALDGRNGPLVVLTERRRKRLVQRHPGGTRHVRRGGRPTASSA